VDVGSDFGRRLAVHEVIKGLRTRKNFNTDIDYLENPVEE
jgi:hypothetical protein